MVTTNFNENKNEKPKKKHDEKDYEVLAVITPREQEIFIRLDAEKEALENILKVVLETLKAEGEELVIANRNLWDKLSKKYKIKINEGTYLEVSTREICQKREYWKAQNNTESKE